MKWNPRSLDPEWPFDILATDFALEPDSTALLVIDMQYGQLAMAPDSPLARGHPPIARYWNERIETIVIPNTRRLLDCFRANNRKIVFTRNGNMTATADEMTTRLKAALAMGGPASDRNSPAYQIDQRLAPAAADLVVDKLTSGGFTASCLDHALRNMGIHSVVMTGVLTDACVLGTARAAAELGYNSLLCEDACATLTPRAHVEALLMHARIFGRVETTDQVIAEMQ
ncbi:MAG: cysteine hydrolase [Lentisphaerae bacterium]|nr:cysteine hydrolase [Lentisphaerota bacterium]